MVAPYPAFPEGYIRQTINPGLPEHLGGLALNALHFSLGGAKTEEGLLLGAKVFVRSGGRSVGGEGGGLWNFAGWLGGAVASGPVGGRWGDGEAGVRAPIRENFPVVDGRRGWLKLNQEDQERQQEQQGQPPVLSGWAARKTGGFAPDLVPGTAQV